mgnify:FL=1
MKRVIEKTIVLLRYMKLWVIYKPKGLVTVLGKVYLNNPNIRFGSNVTLYPNVHIFGQGRVTLEDNVSIGDGTIICAAEDITIGKNTMIAAQCYIIDCNHGMQLGGGYMREQPLSVHPTKIGKDVWLGCGCKILAGTKVSDGAVIGAGTVLSGTVEKNTICFTKREYCQKVRI